MSKKKTALISIRLTSEDKGRVVRSAAAQNITVSEFGRRGILQAVYNENGTTDIVMARNKGPKKC